MFNWLKYNDMPIISRKQQKFNDSVTNKILQQADLKDKYNNKTIEDLPLQDEHPGLDLALMYVQPGNIIAKAFAPSMAKGFVNGLRQGDLQQAVISGLVPESKVLSPIAKTETIIPKNLQKEITHTYHYDPRVMPMSKPISAAEKAGIPKGVRNQSEPRHPIPVSLINRSDGYLPIEGNSFVLASPEQSRHLASVHFTMNQPVTGHGGGSWDSASTTLILPYGNIRKATGPINIEPMDTFFPNYTGLKFSTKGAKVLTGDRAVHDYYIQHGVDSKFSEELETLLKDYKSKEDLAKKYLEEHNWLPDEGYYPLRDAETELSDKIQQIHYDFVDKNAVRPTYEDLLKLEKIEGLKTGAEPLSWSTMRTPLEDKLGYSYFSAPATHSNLTFYDPGDNISGLPKPMQEFVKWMWEHKADYRKQGGILKGQLGLSHLPINPTIIRNTYNKVNDFLTPIDKWDKEHGTKSKVGSGMLSLVTPEAWIGINASTLTAQHFGNNGIKALEEVPSAVKKVTGIVNKSRTVRKVRTAEEKHNSFLKALDTWSERKYGIKWSNMKKDVQPRIEAEYRGTFNK